MAFQPLACIILRRSEFLQPQSSLQEQKGYPTLDSRFPPLTIIPLSPGYKQPRLKEH